MKLPDYLVFGRPIAPKLRWDFIMQYDISSISRIRLASWISVILYTLLFYLDYRRLKTGDALYEDPAFGYLAIIHQLGLLFLIIAIPTTFRPGVIKESRLYRGLVIYGFLILMIIAVFTNAVLSYHTNGSLVLFVGYLFMTNWALPMTMFQNLMFNVISTALIVWYVINPIDAVYSYEVTQDVGVYRVIKCFEAVFMAAIASILAIFDMQLQLDRFEQSEQLRVEKRTIERLERTKSRLYTNIAHEFRSPLTVITGVSDQLSDSVDRNDAKKVKMIYRNGKRMLKLVNQMLGLSKLESRTIKVNLIHGDIVPFMHYVQECFEGLAELKRVDLEFKLPKDALYMDYDPDMGYDILANLISNALKFTPEGGKVVVEVRVVHKDGKPFAELHVSDTGEGIRAEDLPYIFDRFYTAENKWTQVGRGTGIGLAMVREMTKMMDGVIRVHSQLGEGTEFIITFPVRNWANIPEQDFTSTRLRTDTEVLPSEYDRDLMHNTLPVGELNDKPIILVVEDNTDVMEFIVSCFDDEYHVMRAYNGEEGFGLAMEMSPDIVISDIMMPLKDGIAMCKDIKNTSATSHIPVILLTARTEEKDKLIGLKSGAIDYIPKPFNRAELAAKVSNLLELRNGWQQRFDDPHELPELDEENPEDAFIARFRDEIMSRIEQSDLQVTDVCRIIGMSRTQLHNKIKALTGMSTTIFIRDIRLREASKLLRGGKYNVSEVAYDVGFSDPSYFARVFKESYGVAPSEYMQKV